MILPYTGSIIGSTVGSRWADKGVDHLLSDRNLIAVQILLGHTNIENAVRYLGVDVDNALTLSERKRSLNDHPLCGEFVELVHIGEQTAAIKKRRSLD